MPLQGKVTVLVDFAVIANVSQTLLSITQFHFSVSFSAWATTPTANVVERNSS